jgi:hypothetical protein
MGGGFFEKHSFVDSDSIRSMMPGRRRRLRTLEVTERVYGKCLHTLHGIHGFAGPYLRATEREKGRYLIGQSPHPGSVLSEGGVQRQRSNGAGAGVPSTVLKDKG